MGLKGVIDVLDIVRTTVKMIPVIGSQLEGGAEVLVLLCKHAEVCDNTSGPFSC
jgi:hypothetical protein